RAGAGAHRRRDRAAALHRLQQPLLLRRPQAADRLAHRPGLHVRQLALRGLAPPGVGRRAGPRRARPVLFGAGESRHAAPRAAADRTVIGEPSMPVMTSSAPAPPRNLTTVVPPARPISAESHQVAIDATHLSFYYGAKQALFDISAQLP